jgi:2-keto-4-pentenoate hydratase/2-oxohepta-3-ene-1,7-dioic acid hydratase in catechol pathway
MMGNFWISVGNTEYSQEQWGIERVGFPIAFLITKPAFSSEGRDLCIPRFAKDVVIFAGLSVQVASECRDVSVEEAKEFIAGFRPWIGLHSGFLIADLEHLGHQIRVRDHGISAYYGQWLEGFHVLGDLISFESLREYWKSPLVLESSSGKSTDKEPADYTNSPTTVVGFFSRFMSLNAGDNFALGALCGFKVDKDDKQIKATWAGKVLKVTLEDLRDDSGR